MKKVLSLFLATMLLLALFVGCGVKDTEPNTSQEPSNTGSDAPEGSKGPDEGASQEPQTVLFACQNLSDTFFITIDEVLREKFEGGGYVYESVSAEMDPVKQIEQIENAYVQGYDMIITIPVNGDALTDACQRAMDNGTLVFAFIFDTIARNSYRTTDPALVAETAVELAVEWAAEVFPDAKNGSINTVVTGSTLDSTSKTQFDAACAAVAQYPQLNLVTTETAEGTIMEGQAMAENILTMHPDTEINLWISLDTSQSSGINAAIMSENSGVDYKDRVCVTAGALGEEIVGLMKLSASNEAVVRVCAAPGGNLNINLTGLYEQADKMLKGEEYEALCPVTVDKITVDNLSEFGY